MFNSRQFDIRFLSNNKIYILLAIVLVLGAAFRLKGLTAQSLWLDEIHTMNEANPSLQLSQISDKLRSFDPHPPLYFFTIHFWFKFLGFNDFAARLFSALIGIMGIFPIYLLGKEMKSEKVGLIAAFLCSINFFHIFYSQEARNYVLISTVASVSLLFLVRTLKKTTLQNGILFGFFTALMLYSHYFGFACLGAQICIIAVFFFTTENKLQYLKVFSIAGLVTFILYLPWLKSFLLVNNTSSFWMAPPRSDFFISFFSSYFGEQSALILLCVFLLSMYVISILLIRKQDVEDKLKISPEVVNFIVLATWIIISYCIPYVRSLISVPMLGDRYTIVVLPAILLMLALAIDLIRVEILKILVLILIFMLTVVNILFEKEYYKRKTKQEWREMAAAITKDKDIPLIISDRGWYLDYYLQYSTKKKCVANKDVKQGLLSNLNSLWVATGHSGQPLDENISKVLDAEFFVKEEFNGVGTWAKKYVRKQHIETEALLNASPNYFNNRYNLDSFTNESDNVILKGWAFLWDKDTENMVIAVELKSKSMHKIYNVKRILRGDVSSYFSDEKLKYSGFECIIWKAGLPSSEVIDIFLVLKKDEFLCKIPLPNKISN
jgi:uncharacterized membrane protein